MSIRFKKYRIINLLIFTLLSSSLNAQKVDLYEDIISIYDFEGNANDASGNGNHGILHGPVLDEDRFGNTDQAYFFDGVDDYIEINPVSDVSNIGDFTIALWANCFGWELQPGIIPGIVDQQYIFDGHSHSSTTTYDYNREGFTVLYVLKPDGRKYIYNTVFYSKSNFYSNQLNIQFDLLNNWHHIVFIRNKSETLHYIDGILVEKNIVPSNPMEMDHTWYIGTATGNNPFYNDLNYNFFGLIDDIYIYDRAINACEVEALYSGFLPPER